MQRFVDGRPKIDLCFSVSLLPPISIDFNSNTLLFDPLMSATSSKNDSTHGEHSLEKTNQLIDYVESLVATNEQNASTSSFLVDLIDEKFEQLGDRLHQ